MFLRISPPRWAIVASRFHAVVVDRLIEGALERLEESGLPATKVGLVRVPGAMELPQAVAALTLNGRRAAPAGVIALGCVVRGETPHFDYVCAEASRGLMAGAMATWWIPFGFGLLTCDTMEQALARAGGDAGNKGAEAAAAALDLAESLRSIRRGGVPAAR